MRRAKSKKIKMKFVSAKEMGKIEEIGQKLGISKLLMMENAGASIARYVKKLFSKDKRLQRKKILAIAGTGNNGGDAFVAARHLLFWGFKVTTLLVGSESDIHADEAKTNWEIIKKLTRMEKLVLDDIRKMKLFQLKISSADVLIIGIFGTGFRGTPRELQLQAIKGINMATKPYKVSVDLPSGMECDTGFAKFSVQSDATITMYAPKRGMIKNPRPAGKILIANIGVP